MLLTNILHTPNFCSGLENLANILPCAAEQNIRIQDLRFLQWCC